MNIRQQRFCEYYCGECNGNAGAAMIKAGYKPKFAASNADKLLKNTEVKNYIAELNAAIKNDSIATIEDIQAFWSDIMNDITQDMKNRLRASENLAKCKGMFDSDGW